MPKKRTHTHTHRYLKVCINHLYCAEEVIWSEVTQGYLWSCALGGELEHYTLHTHINLSHCKFK